MWLSHNGSMARYAILYLRLGLAAGFLTSVSDRFGLWGAPGRTNVAWGDFQRFTAYTGQLNPWVPAVLIPPLAWFVTAAETVLGFALILGVRTRYVALTNRLRWEGTDHLIAAARLAGARRLVAQSFAGWPYARVGGPIKTEEDPLDPDPVHALRAPLAAIQHLEAAVAAADDLEGVILRYGAFYGPSTSLGVGGAHLEQIRRRRLLIIEPGTGVWSFVHIDDAAMATLAAIESGPRGIYNVVDDEPAPVSEWLPALAAAIGAKPPLRVPRWLGRLVAGEAAVVLMTEARGASNAKAKRILGWQPSYRSWRDGFRKLLTNHVPHTATERTAS